MSAPAIKPMILTRFGKPFSDPDWLFEVKHDGFRALAYVVEGHCRLVSRRKYVYKSFGTLCESIGADLQVEDAVLDGEIVCGRYMEGERTSWIKIKNRKYSQSIGREELFEKRQADSHKNKGLA